MILNALCDYYDRKEKSEDANIAPQGWEKKEFNYVIALTEEGKFKKFVDKIQEVRVTKKNKKGEEKETTEYHPTVYCVPKDVGKTSGVKANILWDNIKYIFGVGDEKQACKPAFRSKVQELHDYYPSVYLQAILTFLDTVTLEDIEKSEYWAKILKDTKPLTFQIDGEFICEIEEVRQAYEIFMAASDNNIEGQNICLLTGKKANIEMLHPKIKGVRGTNAAGANIISFNSDAYTSYGLSQGENAPISKEAAFKYATALNTLLAKGSDNKVHLAGTDYVFWAKGNKGDLEKAVSGSLGTGDNPDSGIDAIKKIFETVVKSGQYMPLEEMDKGDLFYILGLRPANARVVLAYWKIATITEMTNKIGKFYFDLELEASDNIKMNLFPGLLILLSALVVKNDRDNIPPPLMIEVLRCILDGRPLPRQILTMAIDRIKRDFDTYPSNFAYRVRMIKAYLLSLEKYKEKIIVSLDKNNNNIAYRLGRLFAVIETLQRLAENEGLGAKFYAGASSFPASIFPRLMKLSQYYLKKIGRNKIGLYISGNRLLEEIFEGINIKMDNSPFPPRLSNIEQGIFAVGYYHQRQAPWKETEESDDNKLLLSDLLKDVILEENR